MVQEEGRQITVRILRGEGVKTQEVEYQVAVEPGWVVLDVVLHIQARMAPDLAVRWNCKAAKCGSCSAEVNGKPRLMCKTRLDDLDLTKPVVVHPIKTFPRIKDLVTDVSWNFEVNKKIQPFTPKKDAAFIYFQEDIDRVQEMRKCIECFLCQNVCHVLRNREQYQRFVGPRFFVRLAGLEMHPLDDADRLKQIEEDGIFLCNITKCCTHVCPEDIHITDNAIIPLKERVIDKSYSFWNWVLQPFSSK
ncbi:MAG: succinate dehydrogenase/fumarate reductase iron-sulfur subunit [Acidobacteria bacterium]|nr:succinate dehydrogenase/fumarate reductase iron-sulfur subunit [Acidobacteriota bacterium]